MTAAVSRFAQLTLGVALAACSGADPHADMEVGPDVVTDTDPAEDVARDSTANDAVGADIAVDVDDGAAERARALTAQYGACTNANDIDALARMVTSSDPLCRSCGDDVPCVAACVGETSLTADCAACAVAVAACHETVCPDCDGVSPGCSCAACDVEFDACAGVHIEAGPAHAEPTEPAQCRDAAKIYLVSEAFPTDAAACACGDGDCWEQCLEPLDSCGTCVADYATCSALWCEDDCADTPFSAACTRCASVCTDQFWNCAAMPDGTFSFSSAPNVTMRVVHLDPTTPYVSVMQQADGAPIRRLIGQFTVTTYGAAFPTDGGVAVTAGDFGPLATPIATSAEELEPEQQHSLVVWWRGDITRLSVFVDPPSIPQEWRVFNGSPSNEISILSSDGQVLSAWADIPQGTLSPPSPASDVTDIIALDLDGDDAADVYFNKPSVSPLESAVLWIYERDQGMRLFMSTPLGNTADMPPIAR